jgi:hypothetical protein
MTPARVVGVRLLVALLVLAAALPSAVAGNARPEAVAASPGWVKIARARLSKLTAKPPGSMTGYSRAQFGRPWKDVDQNGCDTRNDILARDLKQVVLKAGSDCVVKSGTLHDPYTATTIHFVQGAGTSLKVQIDHVVALAAAWRTGSAQWTPIRRLTYANDRFVLLAVDGPTNGSKGDRDAAKWLPPNVSYHCRYVSKQIAIKTKYTLWVTQPERKQMRHVLDGC